ncbi:MAG: substrate-binding domain-containing protein [Succinivibrionaceae bacterium]|nr:substrate-binding domain-containing protein [Succinivibrionaceae bacterium]
MSKSMIGAAAAAMVIAAGTVPAPASAAVEANVFYYSLGTEFVSGLKQRFDELAAKKGIKLNEYDAKGNPQDQIMLVEQKAGSKLPILFNAVNLETAQHALYHARDNGQPIIFFHRGAAEEVYEKYENAYYIGTNRRLCGIYQAELMQSYVKTVPGYDRNQNGKIDYILIKGPQNNPDTVARSEAFQKAMDATGHKMNLLDTSFCNWSFDKAAAFIKDTMAMHPLEEVDAIICNNDTMALGALKVLQDNGYNISSKSPYIPVIGTDGISEAVKAIANGYMYGSVLQDSKFYAQATLNLLLELAAGRSGDEIDEENIGLQIDERRINIPYSIIDQQRAVALSKNRDTLDSNSLRY